MMIMIEINISCIEWIYVFMIKKCVASPKFVL